LKTFADAEELTRTCKVNRHPASSSLKFGAYRLHAEARKADVKLDQNENPYELPQDLKEKLPSCARHAHGGASPEFVRHSTTAGSLENSTLE
jgi:histidinol-phosphate/aromatic aminotransferase/cobyric acid decarboxylase-like protein